jgi:hypothetical protein
MECCRGWLYRWPKKSPSLPKSFFASFFCGGGTGAFDCDGRLLSGMGLDLSSFEACLESFCCF